MLRSDSVQPSDAPAFTLLGWILRVGVAGCFIGHGAFGIITKAAWLPYLAVGGVPEAPAWRLMPLIGTMDITIGLIALVRPTRVLLGWAVVWTVWTALCRPLAGESMWEFVERAGNYGVPLALLAALAWYRTAAVAAGEHGAEPSSPSRTQLHWILRCTTAAVLVGHAGCTLSESTASFCHNYAVIWPQAPAGGIVAFAAIELALAVAVLVRPTVALLLGIAAWKLWTESLFLFAHAPAWETIERFGSYTAPLALACLVVRSNRATPAPAEPLPAAYS